ncbi:carboxypeptidase regulatory-like domain-containing protein [candidate division WWE3 bacterium]|nr:carboxypeptidase regulatory-like domain-containing protein [candidate division WWE3 bacterium]
MDVLYQWLDRLQVLQETPEVINFINNYLLRLVFVGLAFGFAVLLVEIRLPLKYYWELPQFLIGEFLAGIRLRRVRPIWGRCMDSRSDQVIPLAAVELLDPNTKKKLKTTFSNRLGQYGFDVKPGNYIVRAIKNYYVAPPFYDPENVQLQSTDESFALGIVVEAQSWPEVNLLLQEVYSVSALKGFNRFLFYFRAFAINLANGLLALSVVGSWYGWIVTRAPLFGILLAVGIVFMFIKIYILEAVGSSSQV